MISICLIISIKTSFFRNNELFNNILLTVQIILYHDNFQVSNPLGKKKKKLKISAFYLVLGNISAKYGSRLPLWPLEIYPLEIIRFPLSVWIFSGIVLFSKYRKFFQFCNDSIGELKKYPNKKDWLLQSQDSYNYNIEQPKSDLGTASAYRIKNTSSLKMI